MTTLHVLVRGRVQGVGFRWFVAQQAKALGAAGWVRNTDAGTVEVAARGADAVVAELRRRIAQGPPAAHVEAIDDLPAVAIDEDDFAIVR